MSFDLNLGGGSDASTDTPSTPDVPTDAGANVSEMVAEEPSLPQVFDSGEQEAPADPDQVQEAPSDEDEEKALLAAADDPNTPRWAREQIKKAIERGGTWKQQATEAQTLAEQLRTQYEGKEVAAPEELQRYKAAEEALFTLQSVTATPDTIEQTLRAQMLPNVYEQYQNHAVWSAIEKPDGTPNFDNLQAIVDRFAGEPGKVAAKDVLSAIEAMKDGRISSDDLHQFSTAEEFEAYQRNQAITADLEAKQAALNENARFQETQIRTAEIGQHISSIQHEADTRIQQTLDKFTLTPVPGEPKAATDFKALVNERIRGIVNNAPAEIRELAEISKAAEMLAQPAKKAMDAQSAANHVRQFFSSPQAKQFAAKGVSDLISRVEKEASQMAYFYSLAMKGLEVENGKAQTARPVIGQPSVSNGLPTLTAADYARMSAAERAEQSAVSLTQELRNSGLGVNRLG